MNSLSSSSLSYSGWCLLKSPAQIKWSSSLNKTSLQFARMNLQTVHKVFECVQSLYVLIMVSLEPSIFAGHLDHGDIIGSRYVQYLPGGWLGLN